LRVLIDSSAWVDFLNGYDSPARLAVRQALEENPDDVCTCGVIVAEVLQGLRRPPAGVTRVFRELVFLEPSGFQTYVRAAAVYRALRARGVTIRSTIDCIIAALAEEGRCAVLARDNDLAAILASGLVSAKPWPS
jgi:predicted nucleic acid-binding protein